MFVLAKPGSDFILLAMPERAVRILSLGNNVKKLVLSPLKQG
jgi:hypothetical protein